MTWPGTNVANNHDLVNEKATVLNDKLLQIFVELPKFAGSIAEMTPDTPFIEKFSYVMMEMADCKEMPANLDDELLESFFKAADMKTMTEQKRNDYMRSVLGEFEYEARINAACEEAREEGQIEGREEGRAEGREEGRAEGREEAQLEMAKKLKTLGTGTDIIAKATGLSAETIKSL